MKLTKEDTDAVKEVPGEIIRTRKSRKRIKRRQSMPFKAWKDTLRQQAEQRARA